MSIAERAVWHIEARLAEPLSLAELAGHCAVSTFHLTRAFRLPTGLSPIAYQRARRLSEAARQLAQGPDDILAVALDAQYGSHEAFTRAFIARFGIPPSMVRQARSLLNLTLTEPFAMDKDLITDVAPPRIEDSPERIIAGLSNRFTFETNTRIPALWQECSAHLRSYPGDSHVATYGVCYDASDADEFSYMAGVEIKAKAEAPSDLKTVTIAAGRYAVFEHSGHISDLRKTVYTVWNKALPESGLTYRPAPDFERYDKRYNPETGEGLVEIWMPVA